MKKVFIAMMVLVIGCKNNSAENKDAPAYEGSGATTSNYQVGKSLFSQNCAACHAINKNLAGPALAGAEERWASKEKLYAFVRNPQVVIAGDKYANDLYNKWNKVQMNSFPYLKDEDIAAILAYIKHRDF